MSEKKKELHLHPQRKISFYGLVDQEKNESLKRAKLYCQIKKEFYLCSPKLRKLIIARKFRQSSLGDFGIVYTDLGYVLLLKELRLVSSILTFLRFFDFSYF